MDGVPFKRKGRWFQEVLIVSIVVCAMLPYIAATMIMGDIMQTFNADMSIVGLSVTVQLVASGVCMFIGSAIGDRIGALKTVQLGMICLALGALIQSFAPSIGIFIAGRALSGFGQGLGTVMATPIISTWFEGKERSYAMTINSIFSALAIAATVAIIGPLSAALGGWQRGFLVYAIITCVFAVLWLIAGKASPELEAQEQAQKEQAAAMGKQQSSLGIALKDAQCWKIMIFFGIFIIVDTARATFLPTFLGTIGIPEATITTAVSMFSIAGMIGSLAGGILVAQMPFRKPILLISTACYLICGVLSTLIVSPVPNSILVILLGLFYNLPVTASSMLLIEYGMKKNPMLISGGVAMMSGVGMLLTIAVSPIFTAFSTGMGMDGAFRVFYLALIVSIIAAFLAQETGQKQTQAAQE
ncbi:MAG: MFS transporter [Coriobacteriaceae bacterium]|nr:MFS transporter [Coriobacteriaceae bacterium]